MPSHYKMPLYLQTRYTERKNLLREHMYCDLPTQILGVMDPDPLF